MADIIGLQAVRVVAEDLDEFERTAGFYERLLGLEPFRRFGGADAVHSAAFFRVGDVQLIVTLEPTVTPEAAIRQAPVWLCFKTNDPNEALEAARSREAAVPNDVVSTSFGTRAFYANDPGGLAVYVGTGWD
jgi:hypothetical protein